MTKTETSQEKAKNSSEKVKNPATQAEGANSKVKKQPESVSEKVSKNDVKEASGKPILRKAKQDCPMVSIQQYGSPQRRDKRQREYLKSLGLRKMQQITAVVDNPSTRGLLKKVAHMVRVIKTGE